LPSQPPPTDISGNEKGIMIATRMITIVLLTRRTPLP
jgi:hypothetical protein